MGTAFAPPFRPKMSIQTLVVAVLDDLVLGFMGSDSYWLSDRFEALRPAIKGILLEALGFDGLDFLRPFDVGPDNPGQSFAGGVPTLRVKDVEENRDDECAQDDKADGVQSVSVRIVCFVGFSLAD